LLFLQARSSTNSETRIALEECQIRIESMALIHQNLYDENESEILNFNRFIEQLFESIRQSYASKIKPSKLNS